MLSIDLSGRTAVVTGGSGQLGRAICKGLSNCGANIALTYYQAKEQAQNLKVQLQKDYGVKALALRADVTDIESLKKAKKNINDNLGNVDIIVNNAISHYPWKEVLKQDAESYESQFRTSVLQNVFMAQVFVPDMIERKYGRVIGINTECSLQAFPTQSAYVAGKRGMDGVLKVLAREIGKYQITVNQIAPGWTITDNCRITDGTESNMNQDFPYISRVPLGRRGTDEEISNAVCFLASDLAGFITGAFLTVTGGNVMPCI